MTATAELDLAFAGPGVLAAMVRGGEIHPRELVELYLRRIERLNPGLNAFRTTLADRALTEAAKWPGGHSVAQSPGGDSPGPSGGLLAGVPIGVKDDIPLGGEVATKGARSFGPAAAGDAEAIRRLRAAGAIPIGITNVPELMIFPWTASDANGITRNPWNPARTPGGSSGGSGAAVAAGLVAAATGSDGGGSIRIPAACCGLVGMKPTRGRVSGQPVGAGWLGLSVYGGLARTVRDSALMLDAMHGALPSDSTPAPAFSGSYADAADGHAMPSTRLRIAVSRKLPTGVLAKVSSEQRGAWERTGALLSGLGHHVDERDPDYGLVALEFLQTWLRGIYEESQRVPDPTLLERSTRQMAAGGRYLVPPHRRSRLLAHRGRWTARIMSLWNEFDVLVTPGTARTAIAAEGGYGRSAPAAVDIAGRFTPFTAAFNLTGQPAVTLPVGTGEEGLPLSVQLVGRPGAEDVLYSLAGQIEAAAPWADRRPPSAL